MQNIFNDKSKELIGLLGSSVNEKINLEVSLIYKTLHALIILTGLFIIAFSIVIFTVNKPVKINNSCVPLDNNFNSEFILSNDYIIDVKIKNKYKCIYYKNVVGTKEFYYTVCSINSINN